DIRATLVLRYNPWVRRTTLRLLVAMSMAVLIAPATASIPAQQLSTGSISTLTSGSLSAQRATHGRLVGPLDPRPYSTEFYLHQFACEIDRTGVRQQRSWLSPVLSPVTTAASNLSRRVASLRHALVRMMP